MKLKLAINKELDVMVELGISAEEWFFIQLLMLFQEGDEDSLYRYFTQAKKDIVPREILGSLQTKNIIDKGFIIPEPGKPIDPGKIMFSSSFTKKYFKTSLELGEELKDSYPLFLYSESRSFPMKNILKGFRSLEDFCMAYGKAIRFSPTLHAEVIELVEWAKENNAIHFSLPEFVVSKKWDDLRKIKNGEIKGTFVPTFDTTELL